MRTAQLVVRFHEHISLDRVAGMVSTMTAYGNVRGSSEREFAIEVFRVSHLPKLKHQLTDWDRYGFIRWSEISN